MKDGGNELLESDAWEVLGYSFPTWRKWQILIVVFFIQISINTNASMYSHAASGVHEKYGVSEQVARIPQMAFLIAYGFGCELWAPWSEEFGRWPIQQTSLLLVNIWQIPCALANNYATYVICRTLGGLSTAGGSVTLGVLADMWEPDEQEFAVAFLVLSSVGGSVVGAIIGAFIQLIIGGFVQLVHLVCNPETRSTILLDREARRRRKIGEDPNIYGPNEIRGGHKITFKEVITIFWRPFYMFFTEPIVLYDALIFTFLESFKPVYSQWGFGTIGIGLAFIPILIGYLLAYASYMPSIIRFQRKRRQNPGSWLLFLAPLETLGLFGFAWTSLGPSYGIPWIAPMTFSTLIAMANYAIYQSSTDYQTAAYGPYAASAAGGNDLARDFMAGVAAMYSTPLYKNIPGRPVQYASTILACLAFLVTLPIYAVYWKGQRSDLDKTFHQRKEKRRKSSVTALGIDEKGEKQGNKHNERA
ncbi:major facilitator superfamily domain-containing protein [Phaeosphaeriaceae sp. PMI808]|nr:major facilitator superfamily domain-containing protein [Phaeosphaeriaceae sp. PMI808]